MTSEAAAPTPISACVIAFQEQDRIEDCVRSLSWCEEVLVVDSGSSDATRERAAALGARVLVNQPFPGHREQKQWAVDQARHDWVLCLDADERVSPELAASIGRALAAPAAPVYRMARCNRFLGRWLRHGEGYPDWSPRLFDRRSARWSDDAVHEKVLYAVTPGTLGGDLLHESAENLARYLDKQNRYTTLAAEQLFERGRRAGAFSLIASPLVRFFKFYVLRLGFLDGVAGLVHISIGCMNSYMKYAKLIELHRTRKAG